MGTEGQAGIDYPTCSSAEGTIVPSSRTNSFLVVFEPIVTYFFWILDHIIIKKPFLSISKIFLLNILVRMWLFEYNKVVCHMHKLLRNASAIERKMSLI